MDNAHQYHPGTMPLKDSSFTALAIAASATMLVLLTMTAVFTYHQFGSMVQQRMLVLHTHEVLGVVSRLEQDVRDAESGQRGYLLTKKVVYLGPYDKGVADAPKAINKLETLLTDAEQKARLDKIRTHVEDKCKELEETIGLMKSGKESEALQMVQTDMGEATMSELVGELKELQQEEEELLEAGTKQLAASTNDSFIKLAVLALLAVVCFGSAVAILYSVASARRRDLATQAMIFEVARVLVGPAPPREAGGQILRLLCSHFNWDTAAYWQLSPTGDYLSCVDFYARTPVPNFESQTRILKLVPEKGLPGRVWASNTVHWVEDVVAEPNFPRAENASKDGLHGAVAFPITFGGEFLGVFELFSKKNEIPNRALMDAIGQVAVELGQALHRRKLEYVANTAQRKFEELADSIDEIFFIIAPDLSVIHYISSPYEKIWGRSVASLYQDPTSFMLGVFPQDLQRVEQFLSTFVQLETGSFSESEYRVVHTDGTLRWVNVRAFPSQDALSREPRVSGTVRDITASKEAERRVNEFYSTVSHELRTPLTSIRGALGLLEGGKAGPLSDRGKHLVEMGRRECERLVRLINDILDVRKIEAGKLELKTEKLSPSAVIDTTLEMLSSFSDSRQVQLRAHIGCDDNILADKDRLAQILTNLISNAVKFSPANGEVVVSTVKLDDMVRFSVTDSGEGISKENQRKLFKLFQQVDSSDSRQKEGTGLGLAICKALVEQHGGAIGVESEVGKGATFWFALPIQEEEIPTLKIRAIHGPSDGRKVLIVEDDDTIARLISDWLVDEGYTVERVSKLQSAKEKILEQPAAIILDIALPDGDGLELLEKIKQSSVETPVIIVTAREENSEFSYPLVVDWITKPFSEGRLLRAVQLAVRGRPPGPARVLVVEDDPSTIDIIKQEIQLLNAQIFEAHDGRAAIAVAREQNLDLIVLDLGLPDIDGFTVVSVLRNEEKLKNIPLLVYTAKDLTDEERQRLRLGLTSYLTKAKTSQGEFVGLVRDLLNGLVKS